MKKQLITAGIITTVGLAGVTGVGIASATTNMHRTDSMSRLVKGSPVTKTGEHTKTEKEAKRAAIEAWVKANNITPENLMYYLRHRGGDDHGPVLDSGHKKFDHSTVQ